jgi:ankyrin repeat protein
MFIIFVFIKGLTALHHAATRGKLEVVKKLIEKGATVDAQDKDGFTALHVGCIVWLFLTLIELRFCKCQSH